MKHFIVQTVFVLFQCMKSPVVKPPPLTLESIFGRRRRKRQTSSNDTDLFSAFQDMTDEFTDFDDDIYYDDPFELPSEGSIVDFIEKFSVENYPKEYCSLVNDIQYACMDLSILELWANDGVYDSKTDEDIASLTLEKVLDKINGENKSGAFLIEKNFTEYLSNIKREDTTGRIIGAEATIIRW